MILCRLHDLSITRELWHDAAMSRVLTLPLRLKILCALIDPTMPVLDVGCDHGYLGLWAHRFLGTETTLIDCQSHILSQFQERWGEWYPSVRSECLLAEERDWTNVRGNIVIAGMGPEPIYRIARSILESRPHAQSRLLLCPEKKPFEMLLNLQEMGWEAEALRVEDLNREIPELAVLNEVGVRVTMGGLGLVESARRTRFFFRLKVVSSGDLPG
jgi:hypothetical protein